MARSTTTTKQAPAKQAPAKQAPAQQAPATKQAPAPAPAPATPAPAPATPAPAHSGPYRANTAWAAAHAAAKPAMRGNGAATGALQVATHLAWRAPGGSVAWHQGTNATMLAHANTLGVQVGMPVHAAMALCVAALPAGNPATAALAQATAALAPAKA